MKGTLSTRPYKKYYALSDEQNGLVRKIFSRFPSLEPYFLVEDIQEYVANELHKLEANRQSFTLGWITRVAKRYCTKLKEGIRKELMAMEVFVDSRDKSEPPQMDLDDGDRNSITPDKLFYIVKRICTEEEYIILYLKYRGDPEQEQEVEQEPLSVREIATMLNINENTVKSHLKRGKEKIAKAFKQNANY